MLRLVIVLALIGLLIYGYFLYKDYRIAREQKEYLEYAGVIAETQVASALYRLEPDSFKVVRASILRKYDKTLEEMQAFKDKYEGDERRWAQLWFYVDSLTDSAVRYYDSLDGTDTLPEVQTETEDTLPPKPHKPFFFDPPESGD